MLQPGRRTNTRGRGVDAAIAEAVDIITAAYDLQYGVVRAASIPELLCDAEQFGPRLLELRSRHKVSRDILAAALEVGSTNVQQYESGKFYPRYLTLVKIAGYFNVSLDWLILGKE